MHELLIVPGHTIFALVFGWDLSEKQVPAGCFCCVELALYGKSFLNCGYKFVSGPVSFNFRRDSGTPGHDPEVGWVVYMEKLESGVELRTSPKLFYCLNNQHANLRWFVLLVEKENDVCGLKITDRKGKQLWSCCCGCLSFRFKLSFFLHCQNWIISADLCLYKI